MNRARSICDFIIILMCTVLVVIAIPIGICLLLGFSLVDFVMRLAKPRRKPRA